MALEFFEGIGEFLAGGPVDWGLSRLDLFCDVKGWRLVGDDRRRFLCRADRRDLHEEGEKFTGFEFGRRTTKTLCARIYDKTLQVDRKGLDWWPDVWGERYDRAQPVLRVEVEIGRNGLREFQVNTPWEGLDQAARLWAAFSEDWLTYRVPVGDETKSRWPISPQWAAVQRVSLRDDAIGLDRVRAGIRQGSIRRLTPPLVGYLASAAALLGTEDIPSTMTAVAWLVERDQRIRGVNFIDRIAERRTRELWR